METSDEETEELIYLKFDSLFDKELFNPGINFKIIGLDEDKPIVQLGAQVFTGKWEMAAGTCTFFEEDPDYKTDDPVFNIPSAINVKYTHKTRKVLRMHKTVLKKKSDGTGDPPPGNENSADAAGPSGMEEKKNDETASDAKDTAETELELSVDEIEKISLDPSEVDPAVIDEIMEM